MVYGIPAILPAELLIPGSEILWFHSCSALGGRTGILASAGLSARILGQKYLHSWSVAFQHLVFLDKYLDSWDHCVRCWLILEFGADVTSDLDPVILIYPI